RIVRGPRIHGRCVNDGLYSLTEVPTRDLIDGCLIANEREKIDHLSEKLTRSTGSHPREVLRDHLPIHSAKAVGHMPNLVKNVDLSSAHNRRKGRLAHQGAFQKLLRRLAWSWSSSWRRLECRRSVALAVAYTSGETCHAARSKVLISTLCTARRVDITAPLDQGQGQKPSRPLRSSTRHQALALWPSQDGLRPLALSLSSLACGTRPPPHDKRARSRTVAGGGGGS